MGFYMRLGNLELVLKFLKDTATSQDQKKNRFITFSNKLKY